MLEDVLLCPRECALSAPSPGGVDGMRRCTGTRTEAGSERISSL